MDVPTLSDGEKVVLAGGILALAGSFLPWLTTGELAVWGFDSDGFMAFAFAVSVLGILALWEWLLVQQVVVGLLGALVVLVAGNYALSIGAPATGVGAYVVLVAGVLIVGGAVLSVVRTRRAETGSPEKRVGVE